MSSEKQAEANRKNAQQSTGPRTEAGKDASRLNSLKHGLRARSLTVLPHEDPAEYQALVEIWFGHCEPANPIEDRLVQQAADLSWKLDRADRYEAISQSNRGLKKMLACEDVTEAEFIEASVLASFDPSTEGERLRRHQATLRRDLLKTLDALAKFRGLESGQGRAGKARSALIPPSLREDEGSGGRGSPAPMKGRGCHGSYSPRGQAGPDAHGASTTRGTQELQDAEHSEPGGKIGANEANSGVSAPNEANSPRAESLFAGVPPREQAGRTVSAPNEANFGTKTRASARPTGKRPVDLLGDDRPIGANLTPLSGLSCEKP